MKKKILALFLGATLVLSLAACGSSASSSSSGDGSANAGSYEGLTLEIVSKGLQHAYWQAVLQGVEEKAAELGVSVNFVGPDSESDIQQQVTMLENAIAANPDAIGLAALDTSSVNDLLQQALDAGIPIVGFDSGVPDAPAGSVVANCATDNYAAGESAAEHIWEAVEGRVGSGSVRIGVVAQDATSESVINRGLGFIDKIGELAEAAGYTVGLASVSNDKYVSDCKYEVDDSADVIIEVRVPASVTSELSAADATAIMQQADTIAIYGSNEHSANAIITANENLNVLGTSDTDIIAAGFDSGAAQLEAVRSGILLGSITQAPVSMGRILVETLCAAATGETVSDTDTGCQWYTAENMDDDDIAPNLYE